MKDLPALTGAVVPPLDFTRVRLHAPGATEATSSTSLPAQRGHAFLDSRDLTVSGGLFPPQCRTLGDPRAATLPFHERLPAIRTAGDLDVPQPGCPRAPKVSSPAPTAPAVRAMLWGTFEDPKKDPVVAVFSGLVRGASLEVLVRSANLDADRDDPRSWRALPVDTSRADFNGNYALLMSDLVVACKGLDLRPGDALEISQVDGGLRSPPAFVRINDGEQGMLGGTQVATPRLPGAEHVEYAGVAPGDVRARMRLASDDRPPAVASNNLQRSELRSAPGDRTEVVVRPVKGRYAIEPGAKVIMEAPAIEGLRPGGEVSYPERVKNDGAFEARMLCREFDPVVMRITDHSNPLGAHVPFPAASAKAERRVVFSAGRDDYAVAVNPALGDRTPPRISTGRMLLTPGRTDGELVLLGGDRAATPGTIVVVRNETRGIVTACAVGPEGSFARPFPGGGAREKISVRIQNAFDPTVRTDYGPFTIDGRVEQVLGEDTRPVAVEHHAE